MSWTAPVDDGGSPITGYTVTEYPDNTTITTTGATTVLISGLINGNSYTFSVHATNALGDGPESAQSNAVIPAPAPPGPPTGVVATWLATSVATVSWSTPTDDGGAAITGYTITATPGAITLTVGVLNTAMMGGLENGTSYTFTVHATNTAGSGPESASSSVLIMPPSSVTTVAGNGILEVDGTGGSSDTATFDAPAAIAVGGSGTIYVLDKFRVGIYGATSGGSIREVDASGNTTTLVYPGYLSQPGGVALDAAEKPYVGDGVYIYQVDISGNLIVFSGSGSYGIQDGDAADCSYESINAITSDGLGNLIVADENTIRLVDSTGYVTTLAGSDTYGWADGLGSAASFAGPTALVSPGGGIIYVADSGNGRIRKVDFSGNVSTVAGNGYIYGDQDGTGGPNGTATFSYPDGITIDGQGLLYVADTGNKIRQIDTSGNVTTIAGDGSFGLRNNSALAAEFAYPAGIAFDASGNILIADNWNNRLRKLDTMGQVTTLSGWFDRWVDGTGGRGGTAAFNTPTRATMDGQGNIWVADLGNNRIRRIDSSGNVTTVAGNGMTYDVDGTGGPNGTAQFFDPASVVVNGQGIAFVMDVSCVRAIDTGGNVTTFAGNCYGSGGWLDAQGTNARFNSLAGSAIDAAGNIYVADTDNARIRMIDPMGNVSTLAGNGTVGSMDGTGGPTGTAEFCSPAGVAVDSMGNVYVTDQNCDRIRKIDTSGNVTTVAGTGHPGGADGTGGPNGTATFAAPMDVAVDGQGNLYVADAYTNRIRLIDTTGNVSTLAGNGSYIFADGSGGPSGTATFLEPSGVFVGPAGDVYVVDTENNSIRLITQP